VTPDGTDRGTRQLDTASDPARLAQGEASVDELAEPVDMTLPAISKPIKVLERAGLVLRSQRAHRAWPEILGCCGLTPGQTVRE
jgi:hypothetical protein